MALIEFDNASYSYGGHDRALDDVSLAIEAGEFLCVLGANGSGKSTLARHMNGLLIPYEGEVRVLGASTSDTSHTMLVRSNVGMVFQNPDDQLVASIVEDDVAFGPENLGVEPAEIRNRVEDALALVGLAGFERRPVDELSGGQKQRIAVAGALAMHPRALVLDEASAMLDPVGRAKLGRICRSLAEQGIAVIAITHFMEEAAQADRVIVLDAGKVALDGTPEDVLTRTETLQELGVDAPFVTQVCSELRRQGNDCGMHLNVDALIGDLAGRMKAQSPHNATPATETEPANDTQDARREFARSVLEFEDVSFSYDIRNAGKRAKGKRDNEASAALQNISFAISQGELVGIAGRTGSGKSTLLQLCNGLLTPATGMVRLNGIDIADRKAASTARLQVGLVFQYPEHQLFAASVYEDVAFGPRNLQLAEHEVERRVAHALHLVGLDVDELRDASPFSLSGGEQRRVAIAGVLAMEPSVLVFDEPTAGLDPRSREAFLSLIAHLHDDAGKTVIFASHDMDALARLCDRILALDEGRIASFGTPAAVFADEAMLAQLGLEAPAAVRLAHALGLSAFDARGQILSARELAALIGWDSGDR